MNDINPNVRFLKNSAMLGASEGVVKLALACSILLVAAMGCESKASSPSSPASSTATGPAKAAEPAGLEAVRIEVGSSGFQPTRAVLGASRALIFRRTTDSTCATSVVFPALGIDKSLPLNTDVTVDLPAALNDDVSFQCGMGMLRGKVVVR